MNTFAAESALDATDFQAIHTALRALKMTEHDLSFSKTNADSELVLPQVVTFLQQPLTLPQFGAEVLRDLSAVTNLVALNAATSLPLGGGTLRFAQNDTLSNLPPRVAPAVQLLYGAAVAVQTLLPKPNKAAFDAFALDTFHDGRAGLGIAPELLARDDALELQDDELATAILEASDHLDRAALMSAFATLCQAVDDAIAELRTNQFTEEFQVETDTPLGKIVVGGAGRNVYTNEAFLIIDLGGDDVYENSAGGANGFVGRPLSIVIDLAGNDQFISKRSFSQGSGVFGIGILAALGSNCTFQANHFSQGAGFFGCGLLMTGAGKQTFEADTFCQGAGMFGAGILWQRGGDTTYKAAQMAQGFGGTAGVGLLLDESGNDSYIADGKDPCPWLPGHKFTLAQGFGYGMRPFAGGGIGILADLHGNDRYVADVYAQGASYWYSVGLQLDAEGNDSYKAYQYCQGAGIHLSSGALIDWSGDDTYTAEHICQGAAHDYSIGMLIDRAGDDIYTGDTTAQGSAINNSFALLLDRAGNDTYVGKDPKQSQAAGHDGGRREYGSIALLLDLAGKDSYSQGHHNGAIWLKPSYGAGLDTEAVTPTVYSNWLPSPVTAPWKVTRQVYERVDPHDPTERLLRRALRDTDTEAEKQDAEAAWAELKTNAVSVLPYLLRRLDTPSVIIRSKIEELIDHTGDKSVPALIHGIDTAKNDEVARLCCYFLARFETATNAIPHVLPLIKRDKTRTTAFYTLGHLRARAAYAAALAALSDPKETVRLRAAQALGRIRDKRATAKLVAALDDEMWDVRYAAEDALVAFGKSSIAPLRKAFTKASPRARPHIIEALAKLGDRRALMFAEREYRADDPPVRRAILKWLLASASVK